MVLWLLCGCRYILQEGNKLESNAKPPQAVTQAVSWRPEGIRHRKVHQSLDGCCMTVLGASAWRGGV